jgi:hypothetical protein
VNQDRSLHHATWAKQDVTIIKTFNSFNIVYALSSFDIAQQEMLSFEPLPHATICLILSQFDYLSFHVQIVKFYISC